ncbi:MAG: PKD domain-containing protein [Bacteroidia bacterium]|nr:PKD domain-containing protein [Bacteroidia bacterium]
MNLFPRLRTWLLSSLVLLVTGLSTTRVWAQPAGFSDQLLLGGWNAAVGLTFDENGTIYVWEKGGRAYIVQNGVKRPTPVINISDEVGDWRDFGMVGFALDPNYLVNGYIYMLYVVDRHHLLYAGTPQYNPNANEYYNATIGRVTRYTVLNPANPATAIADPASRTVLIGETASTGFPILHESHGVGSLVFGTDGTLLISCGDGASYNTVDAGSSGDTYYAQALADGIIRADENVGAFRSQMLTSMNGKVLRIDPITGNGIPSNPYYNANAPRSTKSRVWELGLRNPYRMTLRPNTGSHYPAAGNPGTLYIGDVGWGSWEDMHVLPTGGLNCGWPLFEGMDSNGGYASANPYNQEAPTPSGCSQPYYRFADLLKQDPGNGVQPSFPNPCGGGQINGTVYNLFKHTKPAYDWGRGGNSVSRVSVNGVTYNVGSGPVPGPQWGGNCSTGGAWYVGTEFPAEYQNTYFHADYGAGWIKRFEFNSNDVPTEAHDFDGSNGAVVCIASDPYNGGLYYISYGSEVRRFVYNATGNQPPVAAASADITYGVSPLAVNFSSAGSSDPESGALTFSWNFGDGTTSNQPNPSHTYTVAGNTPTQFNVVLTVTDNQNQTSQKALVISVNNTPPVIQSSSLDGINTYTMAQPTLLNLSAVVTDAEHSGSQLTYAWQTTLHHNNHTHPEPIDNNATTTSVISPVGCDGAVYFYRISLIVTDAAGLADTLIKDIGPDCGAPQAINDEGVYANGGTVIINVLANDLADPAIDPTTVEVVVAPAHGTTSVNATTGAITYTHDGLGAASDVFTYTVKNIEGDTSNEGTVTLSKLGPPSVTLVSPEEGSTFGGTNVYVEYNAGGDLAQADHVALTLDGAAPIYTTGLSGTYQFTGVAIGAHTLTAQLVDASNTPLSNAEAQDVVNFTTTNLGGGTGLSATYYNNIDFTGSTVTRIDPTVDFDWGNGAPDAAIDADTWSARWEGEVQAAYSELYTFSLTGDDGIRLWINNQLIIDAWIDQGPTTYNATFQMTAGAKTPIKIEFYENGGGAVARLQWSSPSQAFQVVPQNFLFPIQVIQNFLPVGTTTVAGNDCYTLTTQTANQAGAAWYKDALDLTQAFDLNFTFNMGNDDNGADGMAFALQSAGQAVVGPSGGGLGVFGITPSFGVEFDGFDNNNSTGGNSPEDNANDHLAIFAGGDLVNPLVAAACISPSCANFEDGQDHDVQFTWNPATQVFNVLVDNNLRATYTGDIINNFFGGNPTVFFGWTAGTGGLTNTQSFCAGDLLFAAPVQSQTITFGPITDKPINAAPFALTATASSGLPVSFSVVSGPATVNGNTVTLSGQAGTVVIRASQAGNASYSAAPDVDQSFNVYEVGLYVINGNASADGGECYTVTPNQGNAVGSAWYANVISLTQSFDLNFTINLGGDDNGADGMAFALQSAGTNALGALGGGLGIAGVTPSFGVEFDTYDNNISTGGASPEDIGDDHLAIFGGGNLGAPLVAATCISPTCANFEDGQNHAVQITWNPATQVFNVLVDNTLRISYTGDIVTNFFGGNPAVYFGWTGGTGGLTNTQSFCSGLLSFETPLTPQTITFGPLANQLSNAAPVSLTATASSGLPVSFSVVSGPATLTGNTLTLTGIGPVTVRASQAGDATYSAAPDVDQSFTVVDASLYTFATTGDAYPDANGSNCYVITPSDLFKTGGIFNTAKLNLYAPFDLTYTLNLGDNDGGADGMAFVLQNAGPVALGGTGGGLGAAGLTPSFGVELDGYDNVSPEDLADDHVAIFGNGDLVNPVVAAQCASATCANIEDGQNHTLQVTWDPATLVFNVYFDGSLRIAYTGDVVNNFFAGNPQVYFGITGATGGFTNLQTACIGTQTFTSGGLNQSITFGPLGDKLDTDAPFTVSATASSGLPVSFSIVSGPATISGNTITLTGAGTVTVRASQAGNAGYNAAPDVDQSFEVLDCIAAGTCACAEISNINQAPNRYQLDVLAVGKLLYTGRAATFSTIPANLLGGQFIRTAYSDRTNTSASFLSFTLSDPDTVYVIYDSRVTTPPTWLTSQFTNTGVILSSTVHNYRVYKRAYPAGTVTLGGPRAAGYASNTAGDMYVVALRNCGGVVNPPSNVAPTAAFTTTTTGGLVPLAVSFNGTGSTDTDGTIVSYAWSFGDGNTATGATASYTYNTPGTYTVTLTVTDDDGATGTATTTINATTPGVGCALISSVSETSASLYEVDCPAAVGELVYTDRNSSITALPGILSGADFVRTAHADRNRTSASFLTVTLSQAATVYLAYDSRATTVPSWLSTWTATGQQVGITDAPMNLYSKSYPAGSFILPGNKNGGGNGLINYFVLAQPAAGARSAGPQAEVYPNPFSNLIHVRILNLEARTVNVRILNGLGQVVYQAQNLPAHPDLHLGEGLSEGIYYLEVSAESQVETFRVVKIR